MNIGNPSPVSLSAHPEPASSSRDPELWTGTLSALCKALEKDPQGALVAQSLLDCVHPDGSQLDLSRFQFKGKALWLPQQVWPLLQKHSAQCSSASGGTGLRSIIFGPDWDTAVARNSLDMWLQHFPDVQRVSVPVEQTSGDVGFRGWWPLHRLPIPTLQLRCAPNAQVRVSMPGPYMNCVQAVGLASASDTWVVDASGNEHPIQLRSFLPGGIGDHKVAQQGLPDPQPDPLIIARSNIAGALASQLGAARADAAADRLLACVDNKQGTLDLSRLAAADAALPLNMPGEAWHAVQKYAEANSPLGRGPGITAIVLADTWTPAAAAKSPMFRFFPNLQDLSVPAALASPGRASLDLTYTRDLKRLVVRCPPGATDLQFDCRTAVSAPAIRIAGATVKSVSITCQEGSELHATVDPGVRVHAHADGFGGALKQSVVYYRKDALWPFTRRDAHEPPHQVMRGLVHQRQEKAQVDDKGEVAGQTVLQEKAHGYALNGKAKYEGTQERIVCQDLSLAWINDRETLLAEQAEAMREWEAAPAGHARRFDHKTFNYNNYRSAEAIAKNAHLDVSRQMNARTPFPGRPKSPGSVSFRHELFGELLAEQMQSLRQGDSRHFLMVSRNGLGRICKDDHGMAVELHAEDGMQGLQYNVKIYDPNLTGTHYEVTVDDPADLKKLSLASFLSQPRMERYFNGENVGQLLLVAKRDASGAPPGWSPGTSKYMPNRRLPPHYLGLNERDSTNPLAKRLIANDGPAVNTLLAQFDRERQHVDDKQRANVEPYAATPDVPGLECSGPTAAILFGSDESALAYATGVLDSKSLSESQKTESLALPARDSIWKLIEKHEQFRLHDERLPSYQQQALFRYLLAVANSGLAATSKIKIFRGFAPIPKSGDLFGAVACAVIRSGLKLQTKDRCLEALGVKAPPFVDDPSLREKAVQESLQGHWRAIARGGLSAVNAQPAPASLPSAAAPGHAHPRSPAARGNPRAARRA